MEVGYFTDALIALGFRERKYDEATEDFQLFASQLTVLRICDENPSPPSLRQDKIRAPSYVSRTLAMR